MLDDHVRHAFEVAEVVDGEDVRVAQVCDRLAFAPEARRSGWVLLDCEHHLDGGQAVERFVARLVNEAHATLPDELGDLVSTQFGAGPDRHLPSLEKDAAGTYGSPTDPPSLLFR